jgi:hypothetical protein
MGRLLRVETESAFALRTEAEAVAARAEATAAALSSGSPAEAADDGDDDEHGRSDGGGVALKAQRHVVFAHWLLDTYGRAALSAGSGVRALHSRMRAVAAWATLAPRMVLRVLKHHFLVFNGLSISFFVFSLLFFSLYLRFVLSVSRLLLFSLYS